MRSNDPTFTETARRAQIVDCAIETIAELGYNQASLRKIGERAGVAMSVVMYHFGSKDGLVEAIVSECYRTVIEMMLPLVEPESSAGGKLAAHIRAHATYIDTYRSHQQALADIASNFRGRDGKRLADVPIDAAHAADLAKLDLEVIFTQGVQSGEFRRLSPDSMATAVRGAIGNALLRVTADPDFDVRGYAEDLVVAFSLAVAPP